MTRFELWKDWYKHCLNNPVYKFLVLIRVINSPSFEMHQVAMEKFREHPELGLVYRIYFDDRY